MTTTSTNRFVGYLVSVECKNLFYQGIVNSIDPTKAVIQLKNCFQNGIHLGNKLIEIKTTEIENIEILADPENALTLLKPKQSENNNTSNGTNLQNQTITNGKTSNNSNSNINRLLQNLDTSVKQHQKQVSDQQLNDSNIIKSQQTKQSNKLSSSSSTNSFINQKKDLDLSPNNNNNNYNYTKKFNGNGNGLHSYDSSNESCFNSITVDTLKDDFDFEKNLAMFDKDAFYEEMEGHSRPMKSNNSEEESSSIIKKLVNGSLVNGTPKNNNSSSNTFIHSTTHKYHQISLANLFSTSMSLPPNLHNETSTSNNTLNSSQIKTNSTNGNKNYRYDEMVLYTGEPIDMHQIKIGSISPSSYSKRYVTDDGFVVPCIEPELRQKLFEQSYKYGLSKERQIECLGRCCTEMALQLVGGPIRFSPKNNHQKPTILVLATNENLQGSYALCTARLLSIRSVKVYLFIYDKSSLNSIIVNSSNENNQLFQNELNILLSNKEDDLIMRIDNVEDLKNLNSIDLIINGLSDSKYEKHQWYRSLVKQISNLKASVLTIDPHREYSSSQIKSKWSIVPVMPMDMMDSQACGRIYLCDLGFTRNVFQSVNIKYRSPFGAKFLIPLHND